MVHNMDSISTNMINMGEIVGTNLDAILLLNKKALGIELISPGNSVIKPAVK